MKKTVVTVCTHIFTTMWSEGTSSRVISETLGISADRTDRIRRTLGLPRRKGWHGAKQGGRAPYLPTEEEIAEKCKAFQLGWTDEERDRRYVGPRKPNAVEARVIPESVILANFGHMRSESSATGYLESLGDQTSG